MPLELKKIGGFFDARFDSDSLFRDLTAHAEESLSRIKHTAHFQKGETIFAAGDLPRCLFVLRKGNARELSYSESNNEQIISQVKPNEILGLTETLANLRYETTVEAISTCEVEFISQEDFMRFLREEGEVCFRLAHLLALNLQKSYQALYLQTFKKNF